ncbi:hypothetical protein PTTG_09884 [Puccinia triticina 1-1 BBBD Race 1]|uniref:Uncharacterized protein n=1 Tax=Puccinia triticina (isolate 1-1 / race 1 (BBBD)) TaxID=630390 RepID=A0A0C4F9K3_PUCT1|nr:hypothetical protein PTTG_09884 [Puccinia triticina 1-1 BBBD Race 1]
MEAHNPNLFLPVSSSHSTNRDANMDRETNQNGQVNASLQTHSNQPSQQLSASSVS